jgi:hypothetical protein
MTMMRTRSITVTIGLTTALAAACGSHVAPAVEPGALMSVFLDTSDLEPLRNGVRYEGWAIIDGAAVTTGKFNVDETGTPVDQEGIPIPDGVFFAGRDLSLATAFVITLEPAGDMDIIPSDVKLMGGTIEDGAAVLSVAHEAAFGTDFADAMGRFILATPTDGPDTNETSGIWWVDLSRDPPGPGLDLPPLPASWVYEGWVVFGDVPVSTGRFTAVDEADDFDGFSGAEPGPPFPGEDFLTNAPAGLEFPTDLSETIAVITIEPEPDDSPGPFQLKPLVHQIRESAAQRQTFVMGNNAASFPEVTAVLLP